MKSSILAALVISLSAPIAFAQNWGRNPSGNVGVSIEQKYNSLRQEKLELEQKVEAHRIFFDQDPGMKMNQNVLVKYAIEKLQENTSEGVLLSTKITDVKVRMRIAAIASISTTIANVYVRQTVQNPVFKAEFIRLGSITKNQALDDFKTILRALIQKTGEVEVLRTQLVEREEILAQLRN